MNRRHISVIWNAPVEEPRIGHVVDPLGTVPLHPILYTLSHVNECGLVTTRDGLPPLATCPAALYWVRLRRLRPVASRQMLFFTVSRGRRCFKRILRRNLRVPTKRLNSRYSGFMSCDANSRVDVRRGIRAHSLHRGGRRGGRRIAPTPAPKRSLREGRIAHGTPTAPPPSPARRPFV